MEFEPDLLDPSRIINDVGLKERLATISGRLGVPVEIHKLASDYAVNAFTENYARFLYDNGYTDKVCFVLYFNDFAGYSLTVGRMFPTNNELTDSGISDAMDKLESWVNSDEVSSIFKDAIKYKNEAQEGIIPNGECFNKNNILLSKLETSIEYFNHYRQKDIEPQ